MDFAISYFTGLLLMVCSIFLTDVYATGTGTVLDPFQQYVKRGHESVLQCSIENARLIWYKNGIEGWSVIANQYVTINDTKYKTSANPNTGLYYRLHVVNTQPVDEGIYRCIEGITDEYFLQLTLYEEPLRLNIQNASTDNKLTGTEGNDLIIECIAVGGIPAPSLSLIVLGTMVQTNVQNVQYFVQKISRIYDQTNISCEANSDALDTKMTTTAQIYLNCRYNNCP
ncbi:Hypothetical predicted protein [Mytilus galloprovincialis]|uniref:Immunoglobulin domain-containing protein n=1 Tax=Mytilus galloprovincialis TaxID=29158 RepID=A0A8B6CLP0_MYTGA|nr:Hypothetical predicted protein [Mytilus galloprovincialis]